MRYSEVLEKIASDAFKPMKLEMPKGFRLPSLKMPSWNDPIDPDRQRREQAKRMKAKGQAEALRDPDEMEVTIRYSKRRNGGNCNG